MADINTKILYNISLEERKKRKSRKKNKLSKKQ